MYLEYSLTLEMFGREKKMAEGMDRHSGRSDVLLLMTNQEQWRSSRLSLCFILRGIIGGLKR